MSRASDRLASRLSGLDSLAPDIELATMRLQEIQRRGTRTSTIRIRDEFFYSKKSQEPSICKINANKGLNLQIYLLLLFEAQCRKRTGIAGPARIRIIPDSPDEITWDSVTVATAKAGTQKNGSIKTTPRQNKNRQIRSALQRLQEENLALVSRGATSVTALHEAAAPAKGASHEYTIPRTPMGTINVPSAFFTKGWIYCLTAPEIHLYLALLHLERRNRNSRTDGVFCAGKGREDGYRISRDVYESHLRLQRFSLISRLPDPSRHEDGKIRNFATLQERGLFLPAHRFRVKPPTALMGLAIERVQRGLIRDLREKRSDPPSDH